MSKEEILEMHAEMFKNLEEYALVKNHEGDHQTYRMIHKTNTGFVLEEDKPDEVIAVMIELGVQIADNEEQVASPDFKAYTVIWNEEKQDWENIPQDDFIRLMEERNKNKE